MLLCSCLIISALVGCTPKTTIDTEGSGISESMSSENESESESISQNESESATESNSEHESESKSESNSVIKNESEESSESDSQEPSESESETTEPSKEPSESQKPSKEESNEPDIPSDDDIVCRIDSGLETSKTLKSQKYGLKIYEVTEIYYDYFSDGSKSEMSRNVYEEIDRTGYNATDNELLPETLEVASNNKSIYEEALKYANEYRDGYSYTVTSEFANGTVITQTYTCKPVVLDEELCKMATMRCIEMFYADYYEHNRADGRGYGQFDCFDTPCYSECLCSGIYAEPKGAIDAWYNSTKGHKEILLGEGMRKVGFGYFNGYWVMLTN